jgi:hypothetical protein
MDDAQINKFIATVSEQMLILETQIVKLRASVTVLKGLAVLEMNPDDPLDGLKHFQTLEQTVRAHDPAAQAGEEALGIMEAVKLWQKHGGGKHEA